MSLSTLLRSIGPEFLKHARKWPVGLAISLLVALVLMGLGRMAFLRVLESKSLDLRFALLSPPAQAKDEIILVGIDDSSLAYFSDNGVSWPWPRNFYAYFLEYMNRAGAGTVLFDLLFYQPDIDRAESEAGQTDAAFAQAIQRHGRVILAAQLSADPLGNGVDLSPFALSGDETQPFGGRAYRGVLAPIEPLRRATDAIGVVNVEPDVDGVIRRTPLVERFAGHLLPKLAFAGYLELTGTGAEIQSSATRLKLNPLTIPLDGSGNFLVHWYGRGSLCRFVRCVPFAAVIQSAAALEAGQAPAIDPALFKDKAVIVGATAAGLMDLKSTPAAEIQPGMEIWATILLNLLHQDFVYRPAVWIDALSVFLAGWVTFWLITRMTGAKAHVLALALPVLVLCAETVGLWLTQRMAVNFTLPLLGCLSAYLLHTSLGYFIEGRHKRQIRNAMARYLHPDLVDQIAADPERVEMGGQEIEATVLFSDIYNFTTISENYTPKELVTHLNTYFSEISRFVLDYGGMLDKYTGDGIMAIFGAPLPRVDHALLACRAALAHKQFGEGLEDSPQAAVTHQFHRRTRLGIHSGPIVAGNIGSSRRMDYTAIGDTVNLSARLEGVNKIYKTKIIISEPCFRQVKDEFICRELDFLRVKGKKQPTRIYELIDRRDEKARSRYNWIDIYHEALERYREGRFQEAAEQFEGIGAKNAFDEASRVMAQRCRYLLSHPPEDWDGILTLEVK